MWRQFTEPKLIEEVLQLPELHRLAHFGLLADASYLIKFGADVNRLSKERSTPLHCACLAAEEKMVKLLLNHGADPLIPNGDGDVSIHLAARIGSVPILKCLVDHNVPLEIENQLKLTPLLVASKAGKTEAVQFLILAGAKVSARSWSSGLGCLEMAAMTGCEGTTRVLLNSDAPAGRALHLAAATGHTAVAKLLLDSRLDVNAPDHNGDAPLHHAVIGGHLDMVELLAARGANLNQKGCDGIRSVQLAARFPRILKWLLDHGAEDLDARNRTSRTDKVGQVSVLVRTPGMLDSAMLHWKTSGGDLSRAMETMSSGENILETIFSFQPEQLEVFVNTEGTRAEDVSLRMCPDDGGFELSVAHKEEDQKAWARREVRRLYTFQRPLYWNRAVANVSPEGVLHIVVPGPVLQPQPFPIDPCF